jgi:DNA-binding transcriptional ArsR family regulator
MSVAASSVALLDRPDAVRLALSPIRQQLLARLRRPASATMLAGELEMGRQRINYHLRALETAGLLTLVEARQKRGCVERVLVARARAFVVDPSVMAGAERPAAAVRQDRFAASHLIEAASGIVRDVTRMQAAASDQGARLLTFTIDTEVSFATPADFERFTSELAEQVARTAATFNQAVGGRRYRVVVGGHPAPRGAATRPAAPRPTSTPRSGKTRSRA